MRDGALANAPRVLSRDNLPVLVTATDEQLLTVDIVTTFESFLQVYGDVLHKIYQYLK